VFLRASAGFADATTPTEALTFPDGQHA